MVNVSEDDLLDTERVLKTTVCFSILTFPRTATVIHSPFVKTNTYIIHQFDNNL